MRLWISCSVQDFVAITDHTLYVTSDQVMMVTHRDLISFVNLFCILELAPTVATYYGNRSAAFMMLGTYDKALEDAQNAIRIDENFLKVCWYVIIN